MIAVGGADDREISKLLGVAARKQPRRVERRGRMKSKDQSQQCNRRAERFEASQRRPPRLIFDTHRGEPEFRREIRQCIQRGGERRQLAPAHEPRSILAGPGDVQNILELSGIGNPARACIDDHAPSSEIVIVMSR